MKIESVASRIDKNLKVLKRLGRNELASIFILLVDTAKNEPSESFDRVALLQQVEVLIEQATLPADQRKTLQVTASLIYVSLFSHSPGIGKFLIEHRKRMDDLMNI